jgi:methionyl-tRNA formyltransferase
VKVAAREEGIPIYEAGRGVDLEGDWFDRADLAVVVAFGVLIPAALIDVVPFLNVHFSLLPRWRGASPVTAAIAAGDGETGVTIMRLDQGLDTGPILSARSTAIGTDENHGDLTDRLALLGADLLAATIPQFLVGAIEPVIQDDGDATYAPVIKKQDTEIDFDQTALALERRIRALAPRPGLSLKVGGEQLRLLAAAPRTEPVEREKLFLQNNQVLLGLGGESLELLEVQPAGGKSMPASAWLRGRRPPGREGLAR